MRCKNKYTLQCCPDILTLLVANYPNSTACRSGPSSPCPASAVIAITLRHSRTLVLVLDLDRRLPLREVWRPGSEAVGAVEVHGVRVGLPLDRVEGHGGLQ